MLVLESRNRCSIHKLKVILSEERDIVLYLHGVEACEGMKNLFVMYDKVAEYGATFEVEEITVLDQLESIVLVVKTLEQLRDQRLLLDKANKLINE
jgi:hypothetical protein